MVLAVRISNTQMGPTTPNPLNLRLGPPGALSKGLVQPSLQTSGYNPYTNWLAAEGLR